MSSNQQSMQQEKGSSASRRPPLRPTLSDVPLRHSTSSILTMSKLYNEEKEKDRDSQRQRPIKNIPSSKNVSSLLHPLPSNKKLHRRVLSGSSMDYFTPYSKSSDNLTSPSSIPEDLPATSPGPKLPTFQKVSVPLVGDPSTYTADSANPTLLSRSLSSSKIYDRRRAREKSFEDDIQKTFQKDFAASNAELADATAVDDPDVDKHYQEKLNKMKDEKEKSKNSRAQFFNSDSESDVEFHSDTNSNASNGKKKDNSDATTTSSNTSDKCNDDQDRGKKIKNFFKKVLQPDNYSDSLESDMESVDSDNEKQNDGGLFSKFVNLGGGGLVPGASKDVPEKANDEEQGIPMQNLDPAAFAKEAKNIVRAHAHMKKPSRDHSDESTLRDSLTTSSTNSDSFLAPNPDLYLRDGDTFEMNLLDSDNYIAPPERVRGGVLSSLLKLYQNQEGSRSQQKLVHPDSDLSATNSRVTTPTNEFASALSTNALNRIKTMGKKKVTIDDNNLNEQQKILKGHRKNSSFNDLPQFFNKSNSFDTQFLSPNGGGNAGSSTNLYNGLKKNLSSTYLPNFEKTRKNKKSTSNFIKSRKEAAQAKITVHIADVLQRQRFILRMCKALMLYGAPTHRLEEAMTMTARVLEIDGQFIYLPGCMIVSFGDATTRTSEVQLVRAPQGLNLYKLHRVHRIYKKVVHDIIGVEDASSELDDLLSQKPLYSPWMCVLVYAFSSAMVTPFAFGGDWINLAVSFGIGLCVGSLQFLIAPRSNLYSNVFEVSASIVVSFIGRALGSITNSNICFSAVVQGSLALILPGYIILCGSLELQSRNLVAGSVRMFYAIIYSLFLGFGITLGAAIYGWIDKGATSETTCAVSLSPWYRFLFVPAFTLGLCIINQAKLFQVPIMLIISCAAYVVNYFSAKHFTNSTEFTSALGAFAIGIMGNLYSRVFKGLAVSAMLPAIFVQVPSGIASQGSLLSGIENANALVSNTTSSSSTSSSSGLSFGVTMIQVAIGISVGLFASAIVVYPFGKKSTSIFTL